jgi:hypothetical protein
VGFLIVLAGTCGDAFNVGESRSTASRREMIEGFAGIMGATLVSAAVPAPAVASGGATAGKYT